MIASTWNRTEFAQYAGVDASLRRGGNMLRDSCFDDLTALDDSDWTFANASTMWHLPRLFVPSSTPLFARPFTESVATLLGKLANRSSLRSPSLPKSSPSTRS